MLATLALMTFVGTILQAAIPPAAGAAIAVGLAALGAGIAERGIGAAAVGAIAEDRDFFGIGLVMTVIPETLVILAIVVIFLV
jgi:V/A-type H+-transporting ATPase subunit K